MTTGEIMSTVERLKTSHSPKLQSLSKVSYPDVCLLAPAFQSTLCAASCLVLNSALALAFTAFTL